ncbi:2-oxo acid dehydrogenase subunit E2 [Schlesneria paludicola]|uniref:2-oxo acid dehydrogenase subunit E2 n=1 Tax=Schlesneria paludicola TaxID=360056 RepID=UPI00029A4D8D|nr:2-oxo acid dehydrogenase subunit E2 [Schlesneria paludicola]
MTIEFKADNLGDGVKSGDVAAILVAVGDTIEPGQIVMEIETDKAVLPLPCPHGGKITQILVKKGQTITPGQAVLAIDAAGTAAPAKPAAAATTTPAAPAAATGSRNGGGDKATITKAVSAVATAGRDTPLPAGPATRRLARTLGLSLASILGTGSGGRITLEDVTKAATNGGGGGGRGVVEPPLPDFSQFGPTDRQPYTKLQKTVATNLSLAWQVIPHVTQHDLADITDTEAARKHFVDTAPKGSPKVTMTALALKAVVACLKEFPHFNASYDSAKAELVLKRYFHIGVAVDTPTGLVVPVIRNVDQKTVLQLAAELTELAGKARDRKLQLSEMQGGTFTITNLGGLGGTAFTPIVNYPEVAILGMSRSQKQLQLQNGEVVERLMLPLSLSYDHRVINGADAARFVVKLTTLLSNSFRLVIES